MEASPFPELPAELSGFNYEMADSQAQVLSQQFLDDGDYIDRMAAATGVGDVLTFGAGYAASAYLLPLP